MKKLTGLVLLSVCFGLYPVPFFTNSSLNAMEITSNVASIELHKAEITLDDIFTYAKDRGETKRCSVEEYKELKNYDGNYISNMSYKRSN